MGGGPGGYQDELVTGQSHRVLGKEERLGVGGGG